MEALEKTSKLRQTFADNLERLRKKRGWTQHDLAAAAEMSTEGIRGYEQKKRWPKPEEMDRIALALGVRTFELLATSEDLQPRGISAKEALEILEKELRNASLVGAVPGDVLKMLSRISDWEAARAFLGPLSKPGK